MKTSLTGMVFLLLAALAVVSQASAENLQAMTVGRVYAIEGDLLRYVPVDNDWVAMVDDTPFGVEDTLYSGYQGRAEMFVPNGTWLRVGTTTQIQFIALDPDLSEVDVSSGVARFYNKGSETVVKATSPFGYVIAYPGTAFDFYVGENSVEVVAVQGTVSFIHAATDSRYDVAADSPSILADDGQVASGDGAVDDDWHRWNVSREGFWAKRSRLTGRSVQFLPASLRTESYVLEENGRWESVHYEGSLRWFWRPTTVARGWAPFTAGRWTDWYGDQVWIPSEPFGYVTHHYGNWIYVRDSWYWAPPVASHRMGHSLLSIGFFWSPGRVSWIHHDRYVGWVPLGPRETYYSHRRWGGTHDALYTGNITRISINIGSFAYAGHAIIVPRDNFYRVDDYRTVRVRTINPTTIINNYYAAPVVNNTVINNYQTDTRRHTFTTRAVEEKPHASVLRRIETNEADIRRGTKADSVTVRKEVRTLKEGRVSRDGGIEAPIITNYIVPVSEVNRPISELKLQQRRIKTGAKSQAARDGAEQPRQVEQPGQPAEQPQVQTLERAPGKKPGKGKPAGAVVEQPRQVEQPGQPVEQPQVQTLEKAPGKKPGKGKPAGAVVEQPRQAVEQPGQPAEQPQVQKLEKAPVKKPGKGQPKGQETVQPEVLEAGDSSVENQPETELTEEELEMLRLQEEQGQEKGNSRGKSGKR